MRRPEGTDGSDFQYRMVIENRYKRLASTRKMLRLAVVSHTVYFALRTALHCTPLLNGAQVALQSQITGVVAALCTALYFLGTGKPNKENLSVLRAYGFLLLALVIGVLAEGVLLSNWLSDLRHFEPLLSRFQHEQRPAETLETSLRVAGVALDTVGITSCLAGIYLSLIYASDASIKKRA